MTGPLNLTKYKAVMQQITSDKEFPANVPAIWDLREFDFVDFDSNKAENTVAIREQFKKRKGAKVAYEVSEILGYGMTRLFLLLSGINNDSFVSYSYETAEIWLTNTPQQKHEGL